MRGTGTAAARASRIQTAAIAFALFLTPCVARESERSRPPLRSRFSVPRLEQAGSSLRAVPGEAPVASAPAGTVREGPRVLVESGPVFFGDVLPEIEREIEGAIRVRVFSDREWALKLVPASPLQILDRSDPVPLGRLAWRNRRAGGFVPMADERSATIAHGAATGGAGELVVVDVQLRLGPSDEIGLYRCDFNLVLEDW